MLTSDMRAVLESARLGFVATVTPDGRPNLSPKGTIRAWDDDHLFFLDIASPGTRANIAHAPWMEINVVDQLSRRGYRFSGRATLYLERDLRDGAAARLWGCATNLSDDRRRAARDRARCAALLAGILGRRRRGWTASDLEGSARGIGPRVRRVPRRGGDGGPARRDCTE
jgi:hypothetical protein